MHVLRLLGGASLNDAQRPLLGPATQRHRLALLALLALSGARGVMRGKAVAYLWPERDSDHGRNLLNQSVHVLRKELGENAIVSARDELRLDTDAVTCDVVAFEAALAAQQPERAIRLYGGSFLDGFRLPGATEFDHWAEGERDRLRRAYIRTLETLADDAAAGGQWGLAIERWRRLLVEEPANSLATLRLMEALDAVGDRTGAIRQARVHAVLLEQEFDAAPDRQIVALGERLRLESATSAQPKPPAAPSLGSHWGARAGRARLASDTLVGRQAELERLQDAWHATKGGAQFALIAGEAGIGKTRLAEELLKWASNQGVITARARSYAAEGALAYAPVTDWLRCAALRPGLEQLDQTWLAEVVRLLPELSDGHPELLDPEPLTESWQRQRLFTALARAMLASRNPLMLLLDDLQWCDQDTLQWLHFLLRFDAGVHLLVVGTARSEEISSHHPTAPLLLALRQDDRLTEVTIGPLTAEETAALASRVIGRELGPDAAAELYHESEGSPLFVVEYMRARPLTADWQFSNGSGTVTGELPSDRQPLPPRVQAVIRSRLAQLSEAANDLAGVASVIGRDFTLDLLARASGNEVGAVVTTLEELCQRRVVREHGAAGYDFTHDRLREVAYTEIGSARRRIIHRHTAEALQALHASNLDAVSGRIAAHYEWGGLPEQAIPFYEQAANWANRVCAYEEAIGHIHRSLTLLETLPPGPDRDSRELSLQIALGVPLRASRGWAAPELGEMAARAVLLCERVGRDRDRIRAMWELLAFRVVHGTALRSALEIAEKAHQLALAQDDPSLLAPAHHWMGNTLCMIGEFPRARQLLDHAAALYDRRDHSAHTQLLGVDYGVLPLTFAAHARWHEGYPDQAHARSREALALADELGHPFSRAVSLAYDAMLHQFSGNRAAVEEQAAATIAYSSEYGFPYYIAWGQILHGWARAGRGEMELGAAEMRAGLDSMRATGADLRRGYYLSLLAEVCGRADQIDEAQALLDDAITIAETTGEHWRDAEFFRLKGELSVAVGNSIEAEMCYRRAIEIARHQQGRMLELRATNSLSALLHSQRRQTEAHGVLEPIYRSFTEGFATADLIAAAALLD